jgi:hypothetical protein
VQWPWILQPPGAPQRSRFESALRVAGLHARLDITETASTVATTVLLEASDMAAIMPASLARTTRGWCLRLPCMRCRCRCTCHAKAPRLSRCAIS